MVILERKVGDSEMLCNMLGNCRGEQPDGSGGSERGVRQVDGGSVRWCEAIPADATAGSGACPRTRQSATRLPKQVQNGRR